MQHTPRRNDGFTLVEIAIVMVIIGLLVGAVVVGRTMVRQSEVQSIVVNAQEYIAAVDLFKKQYRQLPGDFAGATSLWGAADSNQTTCSYTPAARDDPTLTCDGDGNGQILGTVALSYQEMYRAWQHLANAGFIKGFYDGVNNASQATDDQSSIIGLNVPGSRISGAGWTIRWNGTTSGDSSTYAAAYGNVLMFGVRHGVTSGPVLQPDEAYLIDRKTDDGMPGLGNVMTWKSALNPGCTTTDVETTANYAAGNKGLDCSLIFKTGY
jgi:prepilin-type N-terminal cleavage/methylation domain-containing protein